MLWHIQHRIARHFRPRPRPGRDGNTRQLLPGERSPDRLDEVLTRLREHAKDGDNRRRTAREIQKVL